MSGFYDQVVTFLNERLNFWFMAQPSSSANSSPYPPVLIAERFTIGNKSSINWGGADIFVKFILDV